MKVFKKYKTIKEKMIKIFFLLSIIALILFSILKSFMYIMPLFVLLIIEYIWFKEQRNQSPFSFKIFKAKSDSGTDEAK